MRTGIFRIAAPVVAFVAGGGAPLEGQAGGVAVEVPLRVEGGRLVVPVLASDGSELRFALSTGNGVTILTRSTSSALGQGGTLSLGGVPVVMEGAHTLPDADLASDGVALNGMIGSNTLSQFDVLIDAPNGRLVLKAPAGGVSWPGVALSDPVRVRVLHGVILGLDATLGGRQFAATIDLGTSGIVVNEPVRVALGLAADDRAALSLGTTTLADRPVSVRDLPLFGMWDPNDRGFVLIGAAIATDCAVALSWVHREIRMCRR